MFTPAIEIENLTKDYPTGFLNTRKRRSLDGLTMQVAEGEIFEDFAFRNLHCQPVQGAPLPGIQESCRIVLGEILDLDGWREHENIFLKSAREVNSVEHRLCKRRNVTLSNRAKPRKHCGRSRFARVPRAGRAAAPSAWASTSAARASCPAWQPAARRKPCSGERRILS